MSSEISKPVATFVETLYSAYAQQFEVEEVYFEHRTDLQHLLIFKNPRFGRVMALDGVVQTTQVDEFIYHEMLTHVPILAHGNVQKVLIIGGGDGGILREVLRHKGIKRVVQVEIDNAVIEMSKKYLPTHSNGAFDNDSRAEIIIDDGIRYVKTASEKFDVIISDSTDPLGPGEVLFTESFYAHCQRCLTPGGVLVTQNGVAFMQTDEVKTTADRLSKLFKDWHFYSAAVPTYIGGIMAFAWASDNPDLRKISLETVRTRYAQAQIKTRYYNPEIHLASFALPQYLLDTLGK